MPTTNQVIQFSGESSIKNNRVFFVRWLLSEAEGNIHSALCRDSDARVRVATAESTVAVRQPSCRRRRRRRRRRCRRRRQQQPGSRSNKSCAKSTL